MFRLLRQGLVWAAIYAIALQTILPGFSAAASLDSSAQSVICHTVTDDSAPVTAPGAGVCDHCFLCNAMAADAVAAPPLANRQIAFAAEISLPLSDSPPVRRNAGLTFARGPPGS